jgi:hypothetical protein
MTKLLGALLASSALLCATAATAKEIPSGGLRVCDGERRCVSIRNREALCAFSDFFYHGHRGKWYRLPRRAVAELRALTAPLESLRTIPPSMQHLLERDLGGAVDHAA